MDWCFSVGLLLAFGAGWFFGVQKCPTPYKWFTVPSPCWVNASSKPSHCKNQTYKDLPHMPQVQMPSWEGSTTSLQYHCPLQFEDAQEKMPVKMSSQLALHSFLWALNHFFPPSFWPFICQFFREEVTGSPWQF